MKGLLLERFVEIDEKKPPIDESVEPTDLYRLSHDLPKPALKTGFLLVRVKYAGFCHTDLIVAGGAYAGSLPMMPGHENVGVVEAVGEGVFGFDIGDRVGLGVFRGSCGDCLGCHRGTPAYCDSVQLSGLNSDGGMAEYILADPRFTVRLPEGLSFLKAAPLMCAGSTVYNSILNAKRSKGDIIAMIGIGGLGHLGVQFAKVMGYKVVAVDMRQPPLDFVSSFSARHRPDLIIDAKEGVEAALKQISSCFRTADGKWPATGVDAAIVCASTIQSYTFSTSILAKHGTLVAVGQPSEHIPFHWSTFVAKDITIVPGCLGNKSIVDDMMECVVREEIRVEVKEYQLGDVANLLKEYHRPNMVGKLVFSIN